MLGDTTAFKREYTPFVRRCNDLEGILREYSRAMDQFGVEKISRTEGEFETWKNNFLAQRGARRSLLEAMEDELQVQHARFKESLNMRDDLAPRVYNLIEQRAVVQKAKEFYDFEEGEQHVHANVDDLDVTSKSYGLSAQSHDSPHDFRSVYDEEGSDQRLTEPEQSGSEGQASYAAPRGGGMSAMDT